MADLHATVRLAQPQAQRINVCGNCTALCKRPVGKLEDLKCCSLSKSKHSSD